MTHQEFQQLKQQMQQPGFYPVFTVHYLDRLSRQRSYRGTLTVEDEHLVSRGLLTRVHFSKIVSVNLNDTSQPWEYLTAKQLNMLIAIEVRYESKGKRHKAQRLTTLIYGLIDQLREAQARLGEAIGTSAFVPDEPKEGESSD